MSAIDVVRNGKPAGEEPSDVEPAAGRAVSSAMDGGASGAARSAVSGAARSAVSGAASGAASGETGADWLAEAMRLEEWMRVRDLAGYDPHDLLSSRWVRGLTFGSRWLAVAWTQFGKRSVVQLRPMLGVRPTRNAKGIGLVLASRLRLARASGEARYREGADELVGWLGRHRAAGGRSAGWGYPFPWANRDFFAPAGTPSSVVTAFVGHALLDAAEELGSGEAEALAVDAGEFVRSELGRIPGPDGTFCFSYTPLDRRGVHNANLLAASLLARLAARFDRAELADEALAAARFSVAAQRTDGSWPYGVGRRNGWVDSFHTGYSLVALHEIEARLGVGEFKPALETGIDYWLRSFFDGPAVGFYAGRPFPIDAHAVAHAILAMLELRERVEDGVERAERLAAWAVREMRHPAGHYEYLRGPRLRNRLPYMRWVQAWMLRALSELSTVTTRR